MVSTSPQEKATARQSACDWLPRVQQHRADPVWLMRHEEQLHSLLAHDLNQPPLYECAIALLSLVFPFYVSERGHIEKWMPVVYYALAPAINHLRRDDYLMQVYLWLGEIYLKKGEPGTARGAFTNALNRARDCGAQEVMVMACAGLFRLQWFDLKQHFNDSLVERALASCRQIKDMRLKAQLHDSLCVAYAEMGDTARAIGYGQMAYLLALQSGDTAEIGKAAFNLATAYRTAGFVHQIPSAQRMGSRLAEIGRVHLPVGEDDDWQTIRLIYQHGCHQFDAKDYTGAEASFQTALEAVQGLNIPPHYVATILQALGIAQVELNKLEAAREQYYQAWLIWHKTRNWLQMASLLQVLGFLEGRRGHRLAARVVLRRARSLCDKLSDTERRTYLIRLIHESVNEIR